MGKVQFSFFLILSFIFCGCVPYNDYWYIEGTTLTNINFDCVKKSLDSHSEFKGGYLNISSGLERKWDVEHTTINLKELVTPIADGARLLIGVAVNTKSVGQIRFGMVLINKIEIADRDTIAVKLLNLEILSGIEPIRAKLRKSFLDLEKTCGTRIDPNTVETVCAGIFCVN